jgi:hypothetical protein
LAARAHPRVSRGSELLWLIMHILVRVHFIIRANRAAMAGQSATSIAPSCRFQEIEGVDCGARIEEWNRPGGCGPLRCRLHGQ